VFEYEIVKIYDKPQKNVIKMSKVLILFGYEIIFVPWILQYLRPCTNVQFMKQIVINYELKIIFSVLYNTTSGTMLSPY